jgi:hypothetical protein
MQWEMGDGTELLLNNRRWELACVESFQGHVISLLLHGWRLSRNLRTFLARLIVIFHVVSSSELGVRATAHIQRCGQTPRRRCIGYTLYFEDVVHCQPWISRSHWPLAWSPPPCWASKVSGEMISSYRNHSEGHR